ncbi:MAG: DUF1800 domain-containing protein [Chloroflexi bacterium]|nr:DUF1800 domain-containing protein [Chloroflexota bacterium]
MPQTDIALIAHLMRRAGFGTTRAELEKMALNSYEGIVEDLLHPEGFPEVQEDILKRYYMELSYKDSVFLWKARWIYRMVNTERPLEEKMSLFWHHVFATAWYKSEHSPSSINQIEMFRNIGMSDMETILMALAKDPAMNYWLDNCENHRSEPNENWGRELLELFSMGVGNYTETDVKDAARAFTGWTFTQPIPLYPYGYYESEFAFNSGDHDDGSKTFLGETGNFNGEDIVKIIVKQSATARFLARHLYNFFVADEPQVPSWELEPPQAPEAIETLVTTYFESNGDLRSILRVLFNSDFFKEARFKKVKSPAELVAGTIKLVGTYRFPEEGLMSLSNATGVMGQDLMNPATVEGWHTGHEWIDGGTLNERINFAVSQLSDLSKPGIQDVISRVSPAGTSLSPEELVDRCLDLVGPIEVCEATREGLMRYAESEGEVTFQSESDRERSGVRIGRVLQLISASREFQFA